MNEWAAGRGDLDNTAVRWSSAPDGRWAVFLSPSHHEWFYYFGGDRLPGNSCVAITSTHHTMFTYREAADGESCDVADPAITLPLSPQATKDYDLARQRDWDGLLTALRQHPDTPVTAVREYRSAAATYELVSSTPASATETALVIDEAGRIPYALNDFNSDVPHASYLVTVADEAHRKCSVMLIESAHL